MNQIIDISDTLDFSLGSVIDSDVKVVFLTGNKLPNSELETKHYPLLLTDEGQINGALRMVAETIKDQLKGKDKESPTLYFSPANKFGTSGSIAKPVYGFKYPDGSIQIETNFIVVEE